MHPRSHRSRPLSMVAVVLVCAGSLLVAITRSPLLDVHWDTAIFLPQAKAFAETRYLAQYRQHARDIAAHVAPDERGISVAYQQFWYFARLGHIATLGSIFSLLGTDRQAIAAAYRVYRTMLALALILALPAVFLLSRRLDVGLTDRSVRAGATISIAAYLASDIYAYTSGNLLTEIPALLLLCAGILLFQLAAERRSLALAACSGVAAFLLYTMHVDSLWPYTAFVALYMTWPRRTAGAGRAWSVFVAALVAASACYLVHLWYFFPLPAPHIYWVFAHLPEDYHHKGMLVGLGLFVRYVSICGGLLWVGTVLGLLLRPRSAALWFALTWAALIALPALPLALFVSLQTRMFTSVFPALLAASTIGWSTVVDEIARGSIRARAYGAVGLLATALLLLVSHPLLFRSALNPLVRVPGLWRIESVQPFVRVSERLSYPPAEMEALSSAIYTEGAAPTLVELAGVRAAVASAVRFFGPAYPPDADVVAGNAQHPLPDARRGDATATVEPAVFIDPVDAATLERATARGIRALVLRPRGADPDPSLGSAFVRTPLVETPHYVLEQLHLRGAAATIGRDQLAADPAAPQNHGDAQ